MHPSATNAPSNPATAGPTPANAARGRGVRSGLTSSALRRASSTLRLMSFLIFSPSPSRNESPGDTGSWGGGAPAAATGAGGVGAALRLVSAAAMACLAERSGPASPSTFQSLTPRITPAVEKVSAWANNPRHARSSGPPG